MTTFLRIAARNLLRNRSRTALAASAVAVSLWVMTGLHAFMEAVHVAVLHNLVHGEIGYLQVHKKGYQRNVDAKGLRYTLADTPELRAKILGVKNVKALTPRLLFGGALTQSDTPGSGKPGAQTYLVMIGLDPKTGPSVLPLVFERVHEGHMFQSDDADEVVLHKTIAKNFAFAFPWPAEASPDSRPALLAYDGDGAIHGRLLTPAGAFLEAFGGDRPFALMPLGTAQKILGLEGHASEYLLDLHDPDRMEETQKDLQAALGDAYEVFRWDQKAPILKQNFIIENTGFNIGVLIFFIVAALGSVNAMMMTVMERTREIGTMMAIGTEGPHVVRLFLLEGAMIGAIGAAAGILLGALTIKYFELRGFELPPLGESLPLPIHMVNDLPYYGGCFLLGFIGLAVASLLPAWRAAKLSPLEALTTQ